MFLMGVDEGNVLHFFQENLGFHLLGVPIIESIIIFILYAPFHIYRAIKSKNLINQE